MKKICFFLFCLIIVASACKGKTENAARESPVRTDGAPAYGDALVNGSIGEPTILVPMLAGDSASHEVAGMMFNGLVKYDTDLSVIGDLAESWDISADGLMITFHLRKGVKWTDGVEFTADDVMFGYKTIIDKKTPTAYSEDFLQVKKAEVIDPYTFRVTYDKPYAPALTSWGGLVILPKHLLEGKDITKTDFGRNPTGLGQYKLTKWVPGQELVLDSNHDYFEGRPYIDRFIYRIIPDRATMFLELQTGGVDMMDLTPIQYTKQTDSDFFRNNFQKFRYPAVCIYLYGVQPEAPFF